MGANAWINKAKDIVYGHYDYDPWPSPNNDYTIGTNKQFEKEVERMKRERLDKVTEEEALKVVIDHAKTKETEYVNEGIFVNKYGMYHCCRPKEVINVDSFNPQKLIYNDDPSVTKEHFGNLYKESLKCNNCGKTISKKTVMVALIRGKGQNWLG